MPNAFQGDSPPKYLITEPLLSFAPEKLTNGDLRMAIACAGQHAYSMWGEEATLTEEFLSKDYATWDDGLVSINHENNNEWVKARIYDPKYDSKKKLVTCSFSGFPDWVQSLIFSDDYRGLSQECLPVKYAKDSNDVIRGFGTGVTIVTDPYNPAATQEMGVGVRPELAAILASKYPDQKLFNSQSYPYVPNNPEKYGISTKSWNKPTATSFRTADHDWNDPAGQSFIKSCAAAITGDGSNFGDCHLFHHEENGDVNESGVNNALSRLSQTDGIDSIENKVRAHLEAHKKEMHEEDSMSDKPGGGIPADLTEALTSAVSKNATLESAMKGLESDIKKKDEELASWQKKYTDLESSTAEGIKISYEKGKVDGRTELKEESDRLSAIDEFTLAHGNKVDDNAFVKSYLALNPTIDQIKILTASKRAESSQNVGSNSSQNIEVPPEKHSSGLKFRPDDSGKLAVK